MKNLSNYQQVGFEEANNILIFKWLLTTANMSEAEFIEEIKKASKTINSYKDCKVLLLSKDMRFAISPDIQLKANEILLPAYNSAKVKKLAILIPEELVTELSVEQTIEEKEDEHNFKSNFFSEEEEARKWLMT